MELEFYQKLIKPADTKILLLVMDGLGGLPINYQNKTELEAATTPHLDQLAREGICGLHQPIGPGVIPGSGPAHIGIFGYDPIRYEVGRGVLSALGINFDMQPGDVAARGNFCTVDDDGKVTDRRAGRIPTEKGAELCKKLRKIEIPGVEIFVEPEKEYRFVLVLRGKNLSDHLDDTDPQRTGLEPLPARGLDDEAKETADLVNQFVEKAREVLADDAPANMALFRGFSKKPDWPQFPDVFGIRSAAIASYPMYRGVSRLVGMDVLDAGETVESEFETLKQYWNDYDFFFFHVKKSDSAGEDGDYQRKASVIEATDKLLPEILDLKPDVVIVTGDHSTPSVMKSHSWHPVPVILWSKLCRSDYVTTFGERACMTGGLGPRIPAMELMPIAMANAGRLEKFGA